MSNIQFVGDETYHKDRYICAKWIGHDGLIDVVLQGAGSGLAVMLLCTGVMGHANDENDAGVK